jgi:UDP-glucose 4-epimerase
MSRNVLVTGGCGYIGSHVLAALAAAGWRATVIDDLSTGARASLIHGEELVVGDCGDPTLLDAVFKARPYTALVHLAASISVPESVKDPASYYRNNVEASFRLFQAATAAGVRHVVFASSAAVYGEGDGAPIAEGFPCAPQSPYGRTKLMGEQLLADLARVGGASFIALRFFNVAGADPGGRLGPLNPAPTHLIGRALAAGLGRIPGLTIFGNDYATPDGTGVRDYIHVSDIAQAHACALDALTRGAASAVLNVGYGQGHSVLEIVRMVERLTGRPLPVSYAARRPGDMAAVIADAKLIRTKLGWKPLCADLELIVGSALLWEQKRDERAKRVTSASA